MKLARKEKLEDNNYSVTVYIKSFGDSTYSIEKEKEILKNYNPKLEMKDLKFSGYYDKIDDEVKRINPVVTYKYDLLVNIPTSYTTGSGIDEHIVTIGNNSISFTTSEVENSDNFILARNSAIVDYAKSDSNLTNVFPTDSIVIKDGKLTASKSLIDTTIGQTTIDNINVSYGVDSVKESQSSSQGGFLVTLNVVNKSVDIKEGLECTFNFPTSRVLASELYGQTADTIAIAKVLLYADTVEKAIIDKVKECKLKETKFENHSEEELETEEF